MDSNTPRHLYLNRWGVLRSERATWWSTYKDISSYVLPWAGRFYVQDRNKGWKRDTQIYDNTGTRALRILAAGLMAGMTSPARPWLRMTTLDDELGESAAVKDWLNDCTTMVLEVFARSNTYRALHALYEELGAFGTGVSIIQPDFRHVINHHPITCGEYAIATNAKGEVDTLYREFQKTVGQLVKEFGRENCSQTVKNLYDRGTLDSWVTVYHCIEPNVDRDPTMRDNQNMAWSSRYFEIGAAPDQFLELSGYKEFPVLAPRWQVSGGDIYGNSPGMEALGDIKQLQHEQLRKAQGIDYMTKPPLQVPTALKNKEIDMLPGGVTYYDASNPQHGVRSLWEVNLDLNHLLADIQDTRGRITSSFYADLFRMISEQPADGRMTATEVAERHEEKLLMLGPVLERLHNELLQPLVDNTFSRLLAANVLPPAPPELQGQELSIEFTSMLSQAQKAIGTNGIDRFVQSMGMIAQMKPDVLDKFDSDTWADKYSDMLGVDPELVVGGEQVALIRNQRAQAQAQAAAAQHANMQADTAQKLAAVPTAGGSSNAGADLINQYSGYGSPSPEYAGGG
jgi:hypothetical protein